MIKISSRGYNKQGNVEVYVKKILHTILTYRGKNIGSSKACKNYDCLVNQTTPTNLQFYIIMKTKLQLGFVLFYLFSFQFRPVQYNIVEFKSVQSS